MSQQDSEDSTKLNQRNPRAFCSPFFLFFLISLAK
uniref:Uncharacterized protein n=1 Tax=Rhizophora mucronata TaxID=61149 RepID=A0A2P2MBM7_RHIMU